MAFLFPYIPKKDNSQFSFLCYAVFLKMTVNIFESLVLCVNCAVTLGSKQNKKYKKRYGKLFKVCALSVLCMLACERMCHFITKQYEKNSSEVFIVSLRPSREEY